MGRNGLPVLANAPSRERETLVSLSSRLKDTLEPVKKVKKTRRREISPEAGAPALAEEGSYLRLVDFGITQL